MSFTRCWLPHGAQRRWLKQILRVTDRAGKERRHGFTFRWNGAQIGKRSALWVKCLSHQVNAEDACRRILPPLRLLLRARVPRRS